MLKPRPLFPGPRPPYLEAYVKTLSSKVDAHVADRNDPHGTLSKVPLVYAGSEPPHDSPSYKDGDFYVDVANGNMYHRSSGSWVLVPFASGKPMAGEVIPLDTDNDLYAAVHEILVKMGAEVK